MRSLRAFGRDFGYSFNPRFQWSALWRLLSLSGFYEVLLLRPVYNVSVRIVIWIDWLGPFHIRVVISNNTRSQVAVFHVPRMHQSSWWQDVIRQKLRWNNRGLEAAQWAFLGHAIELGCCGRFKLVSSVLAHCFLAVSKVLRYQLAVFKRLSFEVPFFRLQVFPRVFHRLSVDLLSMTSSGFALLLTFLDHFLLLFYFDLQDLSVKNDVMLVWLLLLQVLQPLTRVLHLLKVSHSCHVQYIWSIEDLSFIVSKRL